MREHTLPVVRWHDRWVVKEEASRRPLRMLETKKEAVAEARNMARHVMFAHIFLHGEDGTIEQEIPVDEEKWKMLH